MLEVKKAPSRADWQNAHKENSIVFLPLPILNNKIPRFPLRSPEVTLGQNWGSFLPVCFSCPIRIWWTVLSYLSTWQTSTHSNQVTLSWKVFPCIPRWSSRLTPLYLHVTFLHNSTWAVNILAIMIYPLHVLYYCQCSLKGNTLVPNQQWGWKCSLCCFKNPEPRMADVKCILPFVLSAALVY